jgi:hypothetical protein
MSARKTWANQPSQPYQRQSDDIEAAKFLALVAGRYARDRANRREVNEAIRAWHETATAALIDKVKELTAGVDVDLDAPVAPDRETASHE